MQKRWCARNGPFFFAFFFLRKVQLRWGLQLRTASGTTTLNHCGQSWRWPLPGMPRIGAPRLDTPQPFPNYFLYILIGFMYKSIDFNWFSYISLIPTYLCIALPLFWIFFIFLPIRTTHTKSDVRCLRTHQKEVAGGMPADMVGDPGSWNGGER